MSNAGFLEQIVNNLVTNAAKYSPETSTIQVELSVANNGTRVIAVKDQGTGIADEDKAHIFERFYRSADVRGSIPGTGLGLAIAAQLAKLSNGHLEVRDNQPIGTVISLLLTAPQEALSESTIKGD
ncbi:sensor histidine kinase [Sporolactobacillus shoreicorticis]|uniref:sensor histidine kinase n=1 Tax=Sporolactobacillus shoreicorticis TaxID=1923877 RepID=UPI0035A17CFA